MIPYGPPRRANPLWFGNGRCRCKTPLKCVKTPPKTQES